MIEREDGEGDLRPFRSDSPTAAFCYGKIPGVKANR